LRFSEPGLLGEVKQPETYAVRAILASPEDSVKAKAVEAPVSPVIPVISLFLRFR